MATKHLYNCARVFKRYDPYCPRCQELANGAAPREGWSDFKRAFEKRQAEYDAKHRKECSREKCGPVCTYGEW